MKHLTLKILNTVFFILTILVNALANLLPIGIGTTGEVSENYPNLFTPAPVTFVIWGVIYVLLMVFLLYQFGLFGDKEEREKTVSAVGWWFILSCIMNMGWIFAWHNDKIALSVFFMIGLFLSLAVLVRRVSQISYRGLSYLAVRGSFDLYFGWIIAALFANISVFLVSIGVEGFGTLAVILTALILLIGALIGAATVIIDSRWFSAIAVIWAYIGILIRHIGQNGFAREYPIVMVFAVVGIVIMLFAAVIKAPIFRQQY